nr:unnamed protein product [Digitaria exilis]
MDKPTRSRRNKLPRNRARLGVRWCYDRQSSTPTPRMNASIGLRQRYRTENGLSARQGLETPALSKAEQETSAAIARFSIRASGSSSALRWLVPLLRAGGRWQLNSGAVIGTQVGRSRRGGRSGLLAWPLERIS